MSGSLEKAKEKIISELLEEIGEGLILYHLLEGIIWCNKAAVKIIGRDKNSLYGKHIREVFPDMGNTPKKYYLEIDAGSSKEKNLEIRLLTPAEDDYSFIKCLVIKDITQEIKNKRWLLEAGKNNDVYVDILNSLDLGIQVVDEQGLITFYNSAHARTDHMKKEDVIGKHIKEIYQLDDESSLLLKAMRTGKSTEDCQSYFTNAGTMVNIYTSVVPIKHGETITGAVSITQDFNIFMELVRQQAELNLAIFQKQSPDKQKNALHNTTKYSFSDIIGQNTQLCHVKTLAKKAADSLSPVLIYGETGTGKEIFAQSIHQASPRARKPFIAINCAAIPENLLEGILFGTVPGAFTGAVNRPGLFEQASQGTVFLDEINSMPLALQAKLLRVIQEGTTRRVGGTQDYQIDIRFICSCNVHPMAAINKNMLRSDLFYRIGVINLSIPALRERKDDLPLLVHHFIRQKNEKLGRNAASISAGVEGIFYSYDWPGNVRQLEHVIECAMNAIDDEKQIQLAHLPEYIQQEFQQIKSDISIHISSTDLSLADELDQLEMNRIIAVLKEADGNVSKAAKLLFLSRQCLQYRMKKYQININRMVDI